jgi:hypothetical protein
MKTQDDRPASGREKPSRPSRTEEARRIVEEYADDLREFLKKLRKALQLTSTSGRFHSEPRTKIAVWHMSPVACRLPSRQAQQVSLRSHVGGRADLICSPQVLRLVTRSGDR